jgi:hydroxymethylpyrimidine/phosphomethylpyrimidine kinase
VATLVTPNLPEAEKLAGSAAESPVPPASSASLARRRELARALGEHGAAVLLKGGHAPGEEIVDLLWDGRELREFRHPRLATRATHGTGCTLSSAIAVGLARGEELGAAVRAAIDYLQGAIAAAPPLGRGAGPVDHLYRLP